MFWRNVMAYIKEALGLDFINDLRTVTYQWKPSNEVPKEMKSEYNEVNQKNLDITICLENRAKFVRIFISCDPVFVSFKTLRTKSRCNRQ